MPRQMDPPSYSLARSLTSAHTHARGLLCGGEDGVDLIDGVLGGRHGVSDHPRINEDLMVVPALSVSRVD